MLTCINSCNCQASFRKQVVSSPTPDKETEAQRLRDLSKVTQLVVSDGLRTGTNRGTQILPDSSAALILPGTYIPYNCSDFPCSPHSGRYNVGCTKRVGLFHSDRSKLQKTGATTHNRRRASKASLPTLTKDTKKQVRRLSELEAPLSQVPTNFPSLLAQDTSVPFLLLTSVYSAMFSFLITCQIKPSPSPCVC